MLHEDGALCVRVVVLVHRDCGLCTSGREYEGVSVHVLWGRDRSIVLGLVVDEDRVSTEGLAGLLDELYLAWFYLLLNLLLIFVFVEEILG